MKKLINSVVLILLVKTTVFAQPKLVVGIVVDQMRYEFIERYYDKLGKNGFKLLIDEGFYCKNTHYNYFPTYTGPGHASIYTGTTPAFHAIVANDWYDKASQKEVYCTQDTAFTTVGANTKSGLMSPKNLKASTITDQLKLATNFKGKVVGIALKDRGAILPAGHAPDAAYWFDSKTGNWVTSTYYMDRLPDWVTDFNKQKRADSYLEKTWNPLLPIDQYQESLPDKNIYETAFKGKESPSFPYNLNKLRKNYEGFELIRSTPYGNSLTADFALAALSQENMGKDSITDFLCVSFSSTDYVGHAFGPRSMETQDTYLRLDQELERFIKHLDDSIGVDNYVVFLTSDHGVAENAQYSIDHNLNGGIFHSENLVSSINEYLQSMENNRCDTVTYYINQQLYLNKSCLINYQKTYQSIFKFLSTQRGFSDMYSAEELIQLGLDNSPKTKFKNGYYRDRSGDIFINLEPGWVEYKETGATHGSPYSYDTHVPLIWYGKDIPRGSTNRLVVIPDIAKTLASYLNIIEPDRCNGKEILELFEKK